jgi:iron complex outermembrane receptor protein
MKFRHLLGTTALCAVAGLFLVPAVHAQTTQDQSSSAGGVEEVIVTARARSENVLEVPFSIQAFNADQLKAQNITDTLSLQAVAGFSFQQGVSTQGDGREFPGLTFRGMQSTYGGDNANSGSVFVDGIYLSAGIAAVDTADVTRVEVLKGPQNVYFGKNTFGGAINYITANPSNEFGGSIQASESAMGSTTDILTLEGPIVSDLLTARITLENFEKAAQYHATDGGDLGAEATHSVTGVLYATPAPGLWIRFRGHYQVDDDSEGDTGFVQGYQSGNTLAQCQSVGHGTNAAGQSVQINLADPYFCTSKIPSLGTLGKGVLNQNTVVPPEFLQAEATNNFGGMADPLWGDVPRLNHAGLLRDLLELSLQAGYELPYGANLHANFGYNTDASNDIWDLDRSAAKNYINGQPITSKDFMGEIRVTSDPTARLRGLIGITYFHSLYESLQDDDDFYGLPGIQSAFGGPYLSVQTGNWVHQMNETKSVFGSIDFDIFSWLTATAEGRYQHDEYKDGTYGLAQFYHQSFDNIMPRFILSYHPEKNWNFYGLYSEGVQPTNLQSGFINATPAGQAYLQSVDPGVGPYSKQAEVHNWEIGAKQSLFDDRLQYSISLYALKWINQQTSASVFNPAGCTPAMAGTPACPLPYYGASLYLSNSADIKGIEFSSSAAITDQWNADVSITYTNAAWDKYNNNTLDSWTGGVGYFNGNEISRVPPLQGSLSTAYHDHLFGDWDWYLHGQLNYTGSMYADDADIGKTNAYFRVNAAFGVSEGPLNLELYVTNLTDDKNWDWASRVPSLVTLNDNLSFNNMGVLVQAPDRRDVGLRLNYKF